MLGQEYVSNIGSMLRGMFQSWPGVKKFRKTRINFFDSTLRFRENFGKKF